MNLAFISDQFSPASSLVGGALIGISASIMLLLHGRITGISGILSGAMDTAMPASERSFRYLFLLGLLLGGAGLATFSPHLFSVGEASPALVILAGLLVGFGTKLGSGCTSGHGVCGISRGSPRSLAATFVFIAAGVMTVTILGGAS